MMLFSHAGHWAAQLLYLAPVIAMIAAILWARFRGRGYEDAEEDVSGAGFRGTEADDVSS